MVSRTSRWQTVPLNIAGASYSDRSRPLSSQVTRNMYPQVVEEGKAKFVLKPFPGQKVFDSSTAGADRGQAKMSGITYQVKGTTLYSIGPLGLHSNKGTILGTDRCIFANNGTQLVIVNAGNVQVYNTSTAALTTVTDTNIDGATAVTYLNSKFIYTKAQLFVISNVNDPTVASGLNSANAESQPDDLIYAYAFQETITMFGTGSTESWEDVGTGAPPVVRMAGQSTTIGLAALHSVANTDEFLYWLGDDRSVYVTRGGVQQKISSSAVAGDIEGYSAVSDAVGMTCTLDGENFYILTFPTANKTWAVSEKLADKGWFELSDGLAGGKVNFTGICPCYGKNLTFDESSGTVYELDWNTYGIGTGVLQRQRTTGTIDGNLLGVRGNRIQMSRLELYIENGVGLITGQGEDPKFILERSYDGGRSYQKVDYVRMGRLGEFDVRVEWYSMDSFLSCIFRITLTDPVPCYIYDGTIDLRLAGR